MPDKKNASILSMEYLLCLLGGSAIVAGLTIAAATGNALFLPLVVSLIVDGITLAVLGYAIGLMGRILRNQHSDRTASTSADPNTRSEADRPRSETSHRFIYKDHEVIVYKGGEVDARLRSGWKRFATLDELDKFISSPRYRRNL